MSKQSSINFKCRKNKMLMIRHPCENRREKKQEQILAMQKPTDIEEKLCVCDNGEICGSSGDKVSTTMTPVPMGDGRGQG